MNKEELLQCVKMRAGNSNIKFPSRIGFQESNHEITLTMQDGKAKNMQEDSAAFEGWVLCLKASLDTENEKYTFVLDWDEAESENAHYQRFLYRTNKFIQLFGGENGWFKVKNPPKHDALRVNHNSGKKYFLNFPTPGERTNDSDDSKENYLENEIVKKQDDLKDLKRICPARLERQLPVGVFEGAVNRKNGIFPGRKSAIDLWGVDGKDLYIFELKAKGNCKVGVLSELFFYTMVMQDEQHGRLVRNSKQGELVRQTEQIKAFVLSPDRHPFITSKVFKLLNETLKGHKIEFGYVKMEYEPVFTFNREF